MRFLKKRNRFYNSLICEKGFDIMASDKIIIRYMRRRKYLRDLAQNINKLYLYSSMLRKERRSIKRIFASPKFGPTRKKQNLHFTINIKE